MMLMKSVILIVLYCTLICVNANDLNDLCGTDANICVDTVGNSGQVKIKAADNKKHFLKLKVERLAEIDGNNGNTVSGARTFTSFTSGGWQQENPTCCTSDKPCTAVSYNMSDTVGANTFNFVIRGIVFNEDLNQVASPSAENEINCPDYAYNGATYKANTMKLSVEISGQGWPLNAPGNKLELKWSVLTKDGGNEDDGEESTDNEGDTLVIVPGGIAEFDQKVSYCGESAGNHVTVTTDLKGNQNYVAVLFNPTDAPSTNDYGATCGDGTGGLKLFYDPVLTLSSSSSGLSAGAAVGIAIAVVAVAVIIVAAIIHYKKKKDPQFMSV